MLIHTKILAWFLLFLLGLFLPACIPVDAPLPSEQALIRPIPTTIALAPVPTAGEIRGAMSTPDSKTAAVIEQTPAQPAIESTQAKTDNPSEGNAMTTITISVNDSSFSAQLYDNETTRALLAQFPLTLDMSELNGNEKYYYLPENLPAVVAEKPETIHAGEIMLYSSNCLVLFYNTFSNTYAEYVKLG
jgi:hypothetical protein